MNNLRNNKILPLSFQILPLFFIKLEKGCTQACCMPKDLLNILYFLRDFSLFKFKILSTISVVDFPQRKRRFEVVYELLSPRFNHRFRLKTWINEYSDLSSVQKVFACANWIERENWDLFGIFFKNHPDLRRLLSDYGFEGHPLRKDFPLSGYVDLRYDENVKKVIIEPFIQDQSFRVFDYNQARI